MPTNESHRYRIVVRGRLGDHVAFAFDSLTIVSEGDETSLTGAFQDQAALHGLFDRLRDLGIAIVSVNPDG